MRRGTTEIRLNEDGTLDEVCAWGFVHLEQMDTNCWLLLIDTVDGKRLRVPLSTKRSALKAFAEVDGASTFATALLGSVRTAIHRDRARINRNRRRKGMPTLEADERAYRKAMTKRGDRP